MFQAVLFFVNNQQEIVLIGAGGHCRSCIDVLSNLPNYSILGIIDKEGSKIKDILGHKVLGTDNDLEFFIKQCSNVLVTVGQIKSPEIRISLFEKAKSKGAVFPFIKSHVSYLSKSAQIGEGTILLHYSLINSSVKIGTNCIINTKALIEHDSEIGSHCHVSTGVIINGGVVVEDRCFIGSGAIVHEGVKIGEGSIISAGSIVRGDVSKGTLLK